MISLLTTAAPILLGFFAKLLALRSQAASDNHKLMLESFAAKGKSISNARVAAEKESPMAAWNRRVIIFVILGLIIFTQMAPVLFDVDTVIPTVREGFSLLGFTITPDQIEYVTVSGLIKFEEVFTWATMIVEFYFGAQLAKGK
tara:strand:- start:1511 stop:1942 length:432 start_codon:yes stop_codon:yes gene_type:complete